MIFFKEGGRRKEDSLRAEEAVRGGQEIHRSWRPLRGGTTSASAATVAPSRDFPTREPSVSARLTSAGCWGNTSGPTAYGQGFEV